MKKPRHIPIRTCVACRETDEKRDLIRVVRQPEGTVVVDPTGKMSGRGAYICVRRTCVALARKQKKLERSLKVSAISDTLFGVLTALLEEKEREAVGDARPAGEPPALAVDATNHETSQADRADDPAVSGGLE